MESQPLNPEFTNNPENLSHMHALAHIFSAKTFFLDYAIDELLKPLMYYRRKFSLCQIENTENGSTVRLVVFHIGL